MRFVILPIIVSRDGKVPHELAAHIVETVRRATAAEEQREERPRMGRPPKCGKTHTDLIKEFVSDQCETGPGRWTSVAEMWRVFQRWTCRTYACVPIGREAFAIEMTRLGFEYSRTRRVADKQQRTWEGISVMADLIPQGVAPAAVRKSRDAEFDALRDQLIKTLDELKARVA